MQEIFTRAQIFLFQHLRPKFHSKLLKNFTNGLETGINVKAENEVLSYCKMYIQEGHKL